MAKEKIKDEQALENKCPSCTASIKFNPKEGKFKCEYCGSIFTLEELKEYNKTAATAKDNKKKEEQVIDTYDGYVSYHCGSCGAEIVADEQTAATFCVYCGNTAILKSKLAGEFTPSRIIPFEKTKEEAIQAFKGISKGRPLMPKDFNSEKNIEKIKGVYIPFWLYDVKVSGDVNMRGTIVTSWSIGDTHYTKTDTYNVVRGGTVEFHKIPVDGSTHFDNKIMNSLEPFNFNKLVNYNHAYLSGFYAEKYDEDSTKSFQEASDRAYNSTKNLLSNNARRYTTKTITSDTLNREQTDNEYVLLPVWMVNVKYKNKMHIFAMNGESGEFIGNIPLSGTRVLVYSLVIFISLFICFSIASYILYLVAR